MRYRAFISYSHRDEVQARRLHRRLERYRPPKGLELADGSRPLRLYPIYRDRDEMAASQSLPATIEAALADSEYLIVLCSPFAATSEWVGAEIRLFADIASSENIFPIIVGGDDNDDALACFPPALLELLDDPLAPDLREGKDGFDDGALKLIAGLWGTPFSTLRDREAAWRRRRAQLNLALAAFVGGLAVLAGLSAWRAQEQKQLAEAEAQIAEARSLASLARFTLDRNPGETSVAAMVAVQSLSLSDTPAAKEVLRDALAFAPLGAVDVPFRWQTPRITTSADGKTAAFFSVTSHSEEPAYSEVVSLNPDLTERGRLAFDGKAVPMLTSDGKWMAITGLVRRLVIQRVDTGEIALDQPITSGASSAFSQNGSDFYAATQLGEILHWQVAEQTLNTLTTIPVSHRLRRLPQFAVLPDNEWLLHAKRGEPAKVISTKNDEVKTLPFEKTFETTGFRVQEPSGAITPPIGTRVITYDTFNTGALWDVETMRKLWTFDDRERGWSRMQANAISADGMLFARGHENADVLVRDMDDGATVREFDHGGEVYSLQFLEDSHKIAAAGDGGVSIWNIADAYEPIRCAEDVDITAMAIESGQDTLLIGSDDGRLIRCHSVTGEILSDRRFSGPITSIVSASGGLAISLKLSARADNWSEVTFFNSDTGNTVHRSINEPFDDLILSADGARAATRWWNKREVAIWDTANGEIVSRISAKGNLAGFSSDNERLLMRGDSLAVFDIESGEPIANLGESAGVRSISSPPDRDLLITHGNTESGSQQWGWNAETGEWLWSLPGEAVLSARGDIYALHDEQTEHLIVMNRTLNTEIGRIAFPGELVNVALTSTGNRLIASRRRQNSEGHFVFEAEFWDVRSNKKLWIRQQLGQPGPMRFAYLTEERAVFVQPTLDKAKRYITQLEILDWETGTPVFEQAWPSLEFATWVADPQRDELLLTIGAETMLLDMNNGSKRWTIHEKFDDGMALTPDGLLVIAVRSLSNNKSEIVVLNRRDGAVIRRWTVDANAQDVAVTSDSKLVMMAVLQDNWNGIKAWHIDGGEHSHDLEMDAQPLSLVTLQAPHELIVRDREGAVRAFDLRDARPLRRFAMSIRAGNGAFTADGQHAYTINGSRIRFWNAESGAELASIAVKGNVETFAVSSDGKEIAFITSRNRPASNGAKSKVVEIWQPLSEEGIETLPVVGARRIAYDPTDSVVALLSGNETVRVVDAHTLSPRFTLRSLVNGSWHGGENWATFSLDGAYLALVAEADYGQGNLSERRQALRIFETTSGVELARFDIHPIRTVSAASNTGFIYVDAMGRVRHIDLGVVSLDQILTARLATTLRSIPDSDLLLATGAREDALIDIVSGARFDLTVRNDNEFTRDSAVDSTGHYVAILRQYSQGEKRHTKIHVFDAITGDELASLRTAVNELSHIEFALGGEMIVVSQVGENELISDPDQAGALFSWKWRDGQLQPLITDNLVAGFAVSADGESLMTSEGKQVYESDEVIGRLQTRLVHLADASIETPLPKTPDTPQIVVSANGERFGLFSNASPISGAIYNADGEKLLEILLQDAAFHATPLGFLQNGELFALGERSGARVYNLSTGAVRRLRVPGKANRYSLSGDKAFLAIGGEEFVSIWDMATFERVADLQVTGLRSMTFAGSDARSLVAVTSRGILRLEWDQAALIKMACETFRNDDWESGRKRITATEVPELCSESP